MCSQPVPFSIREAAASDNKALLDLERSAPLDLGEVEVILDRSPDYFACLSLQEDARVMVAEEAGQLVGVCAAARQTAPLLGRPQSLLYIQKGRVRPQCERRHISSLLVWALVESWRTRGIAIDSPYFFISTDNEKSLSAVQQGGLRPWPKEAHLVEIDVQTRRPPALPVVRLGADRVQEVVALINSTHVGKELFSPYTVERLQARLGRTSEYSWHNWWGIEDPAGRLVAVAGLLDWGLWWRMIRRLKSTGDETTSSAAGVFDFGYTDGGEQQMAELLCHLLDVTASWGRHHLSICLDPEESLYALLPAPARASVIFRFFATGIVPSASDMGRLYLDPAYL